MLVGKVPVQGAQGPRLLSQAESLWRAAVAVGEVVGDDRERAVCQGERSDGRDETALAVLEVVVVVARVGVREGSRAINGARLVDLMRQR